ncbi:hypothetical protein DFJ43DRAFT_1058806 [Lentinula guzmanii]|uniref:Secreted protein n=1 Tax=Lentinula guzmanii TaxID=2804957 RepID=A0AA38JFT9_9AGAR|nr:hypothetical protein DFJ43DRAFT_1058806 [Lentinula guzmanii]
MMSLCLYASIDCLIKASAAQPSLVGSCFAHLFGRIDLAPSSSCCLEFLCSLVRFLLGSSCSVLLLSSLHLGLSITQFSPGP